MKSKIIFSFVLTAAFYAALSNAQWTPDPFCPYPSYEVTRYPYYGNCSVYWECYEGTKYVMECPEGLQFNAPLQECDTPEIANCDPYASTTSNPNPPTWTTISTSSQGPHPNCPFPSDELTFFPYPGDCTKYWECFEGDAYLYQCPDNLWWHQSIENCDYPGSYCTDGVPTTGSPTTEHGQPTCIGSGGNPEFYPYDGDCTLYWECIDGTPYLGHCPSGLWWHQAISECDLPGGFCSDHTTTSNHGQPNCAGSGPNPVFYPYEGDCRLYWECINGDTYLGECASGLWWHQALGECDEPGNYCNDNPPPPTTTSNHGQPNCAGSGSNPVFYPYEGDCALYWECVNGETYLGECADGLWWHQAISECDYPGDFCNYQTPPTHGTGPTEDPNNITCPDPNDTSVYFPYQGDCTKYWECFEGVKYVNTCPSGQWWHQSISSCDAPGSYCQQ